MRNIYDNKERSVIYGHIDTDIHVLLENYLSLLIKKKNKYTYTEVEAEMASQINWNLVDQETRCGLYDLFERRQNQK